MRVAVASLAGCALAPDARATRGSPPRARAARALSSRATLRRQGGAARLAASTSAPGRRRGSPRAGPVSVRALVNIDLGPSAILGASVMVSAIGLYQVRASRPEVSRDQDVFFSSIGLLTGGILVFQGWRLDPLMLFGQLLTAGTAISFASEAVGLRQEILDREAAEMMRGDADARESGRRGYARRGGSRRGGSGGGGGGGPPRPLPPPRASRAPYRDQDVSSRRGGWNDAPDDWDARSGADPRLNARGAAGGRDGRRPPDPRDEYVFDASYGQTVGGPRDATYTRASGRFEGDDFTTDTNGGFMDAFEGARDGDVSSPRERSARDEKTKKPSDGSLGDAFGPARFGSEADDWEL
jgi:hypothetical protein